MKVFLPLLFLAIILGLASPNKTTAQASDAARTLTLINQARQSAGLPPLASNAQLAASAQAHANDMLQHGVGIGHGGTDGSTPAVRVVRAGYRAYSWGPYVGENWAAWQTVDISMNWWMRDAVHRDNILRPGYREIGIGIAYLPEGFPIVVTDFGAQPNVLPIYMSGSGPSVTVTMTNEEAVPDGDGPGVMGRAVQVDLSPNADMSGAQTFPFAQSITLTSADGSPISQVYARFHDAQGRTAQSSTSPSGPVIAPAVAATKAATARPSATRTRTRTPRPTSTRTRPPTRTPAPPTRTWTPAATDTVTATLYPTETEEAEPTATVVVVTHAAVESASASGSLWSIGRVLIAAVGIIALIVLIFAVWQLKNGF